VAVAPDGSKAYVAETLAGTVAIVSLTEYRVIERVKVGIEPRAVVLTHSGKFLYVANSVSEHHLAARHVDKRVLATLHDPGAQRHAAARPRRDR
jgi:YVTN family beta-propeller protein